VVDCLNYQLPPQGYIRVSDFEKFAVTSGLLVRNNYQQSGRMLNLNQLIKVSPSDEGENVIFKTMDEVNIKVPDPNSIGNWDKIILDSL
jgi:hypothetical protein